jgi:hypothetical protein
MDSRLSPLVLRTRCEVENDELPIYARVTEWSYKRMIKVVSPFKRGESGTFDVR